MQQTIDQTSTTVTQAITRLQEATDRMANLFTFVPDDKLHWSPSPTAKSSLGLVAHAAVSCGLFIDAINGNLPEKLPTPQEFFKAIDEEAAKVTTRDSAVALLKESTAVLSSALQTVNAGNIESSVDSPFGPMPMQFVLFACGDHVAGHANQLAYLQTIWGDLDNHFG